MKISFLFLAFTGIALLTACNRSSDSMSFSEAYMKAQKNNYDMAIQSGLQGNSIPGQFNRLFPNAVNGISYYTGEIGSSKWYSKTGLYGRYVVRMFCEIKLDKARTNIISMGPPGFDMGELTKITLNPNGSTSIQTRPVAPISLDTWQRLVDAKGNFQAVGIILKTNQPVENFEAVWRKF
jgi:hypothetical protein